MGVRDVGRVGDVWPDGRGRVEDLARGPLAGDELEIASTDVVDDRVTEDVIERLLAAHEARRLADDDAELDLPVERVRSAGTEDRLAGVQDRIRPLREDRRLLRNRLVR